MTVNALILINIEPANGRSVLNELKSLPDVEVSEVMGAYDIMVELQADSVEDIADILSSKIRPMEGINNAVPCMWVPTRKCVVLTCQNRAEQQYQFDPQTSLWLCDECISRARKQSEQDEVEEEQEVVPAL